MPWFRFAALPRENDLRQQPRVERVVRAYRAASRTLRATCADGPLLLRHADRVLQRERLRPRRAALSDATSGSDETKREDACETFGQSACPKGLSVESRG